MSSRLGVSDLDDFVVGATLLGSGGGGVAELYAHQLRQSLPADGIELVPLTEAADRGIRTIAAVGMIGATSVLTEKLPHGGEIAEAVAAAERWTGLTVDALMPVEAAGVNATLPVSVACELGLPLVDADLMGRALPRFDQLSLVAAAPERFGSTMLVQPGGQVLVLDRATPLDLERTVRGYVAHAGGWAGAAFGPFALQDVLGRACENTLARAIELGRAFSAVSGTGDARPFLEATGGILLGAGRVIDIVRASTDRFARTSFAIADHAGPLLRIEAENEFLAAIRDGTPVVTCPELICVLDRRLIRPLAVEQLRFGDDVQVIALPGPAWWTGNPHLISVVGPRAFGIDLDPVLLGTGPVRRSAEHR